MKRFRRIFSLDKNAFRKYKKGIQGEDSIQKRSLDNVPKHDKADGKADGTQYWRKLRDYSDLNEYFPFDEDNYDATDSIIEVMLALDLSLISMKQRCLNAWYSPADKQCEQFSVKNEEDNMLLFDIISRLPRQTDTFLPDSLREAVWKPQAIYLPFTLSHRS